MTSEQKMKLIEVIVDDEKTIDDYLNILKQIKDEQDEVK